jgi:hypothetical protein
MVVLGSGRFTYEVSGEDWGRLPQGWSYKEATSVAVDANDQVYVFNRGANSPVIVFSPEGEIVSTWGEGVFTRAHGVRIGPDGSVFCVDDGAHAVRKFTPEGKLLMTIGEPGKAAPPMSGKPFNRPTDVAVDPRDGFLYISDGYSNARVHKYTPDGEYVTSWGESGTDPGQFNIVHNIQIDNQGRVFVCDRENQRIQIFDTDGNYVDQWNNMSRAACVCFDPNDDDILYIGEYFCGIGANRMATRLGPRVSVYTKEGKLLARAGEQPYGEEAGRFFSPHGIACDSRGDIYVAEVSWSDYGSRMDPPRELRSMQKLVRKG